MDNRPMDKTNDSALLERVSAHGDVRRTCDDRTATVYDKPPAYTVDDKRIFRSSFFARGINALHVEILDHGYFYGDESWNQFDVISPYARLYFMAKDSGWIESGGRRTNLEPGHMYLIPPFLRVNLRTEKRIEKFYLHLNCSYAGLNLLDQADACYTLDMDPDELKRMLAAYEGRRLDELLYFKAKVFEILSSFASRYIPDLHERLILADRYREVHQYVRSHLDFRLSYRDVAKALKLSPDVLRLRYAQDSGSTLNRYIHAQLVQLAAMKLLNTELRIREIATQLGFQDEFYFSRFFKKRMLYSPREYRRLNGYQRRIRKGSETDIHDKLGGIRGIDVWNI